VFEATVKFIVVDPPPRVFDVISSHSALLAAIQLHPEEVVRVKPPLPPFVPKEAPGGETE
jgi:hypothetical protein